MIGDAVSASCTMTVIALALLAAPRAAVATGLVTQEITPALLSGLRYRHIGPPGNRTSAVVGVPGDPMTCYIGAASGGVWKTTDGGIHWDPVFDDQPAQSIGALAIAPSDANVVWAGTGEAFIRSNVSLGNGVYKSTDAGKTWRHMGLDLSGRVGRIVIDPRDPDIVFVAALGHCYGPQRERGVFRTTDGGESWEHVLFVDDDTGCFEIAMSPGNPRILFAGMWPLEIFTWGRESGGPGGGIYRSTDGGTTWTRLEGRGLPAPPIGKVGLAIANSNPDVIYALMETGAPNRGVLWRSADGGDSWRLMSHDRILNERPHYASRILVNPADENEVYFAANSHSITRDGGLTTERTGWSGDTHDMWADPLDPDRIMLSDDGGALISLNRGRSWHRIVLPVAQMYHVAVDNRIPYYVYGGMQDGPGYRGPSTARVGVGRSPDWKSTAGGECGFILPDPVDPNVVWGGSYNAGFTRVDYRNGHNRTVKVWPESAYGSSADLLKYRFNWTFPIVISPHDHETIYVGSQFVHRTTDGGASWEVISPDLSTNDLSRMGPSGGLTKDNIGVEYACIVFALAESPLERGVIWAGTNDGLLHITRDGGGTWTDITVNIPDLPKWGTVSNIEPSRYDAAKCYVTVDFHQVNDRDPYVYKTDDYGQSWTSISEGISQSVFSYVHWVHEDPVRPGLLYLGTENAIYVSFDDGAHWLSLQSNLPHAPVHHMVVQEHFNDLVVATYGRGFWIMDDITPLQQLTDDVLASDAHLFAPRAAYRMHGITGGPRVIASATINYYLREPSEGPVQLTILDDQDNVVRTLEGPADAGINRASWDLRYEGAKEARLRTKPPGNPRVVEEKRFRTTWEREGWYPIRSWGTGGGFRGIRVAPGTYTVKMSIGDQEHVQTLEVRKDPHSDGTAGGIREQVAMQLELRDDLNAVSDLVSRIEWIKRQLGDLKTVLDAGADEVELGDAADALLADFQSLQDRIFQKVQAEGDSKSFRFPNLLYSKLSVLAGDVAQSIDFPPNAQQREVHQVLKARLADAQADFETLLAEDVSAFNDLLLEHDVRAGIVIPQAAVTP
jgi:photosystem II stability/assembly factor-like uncharacterized protein